MVSSLNAWVIVSILQVSACGGCQLGAPGGRAPSWEHRRDCSCGDRGRRLGPGASASSALREKGVISFETQQISWYGAPGDGNDLEG